MNSGGEIKERILRNDVRNAAFGIRGKTKSLRTIILKNPDHYFKKSHYLKKSQHSFYPGIDPWDIWQRNSLFYVQHPQRGQANNH